jgi:hypothetical protein
LLSALGSFQEILREEEAILTEEAGFRQQALKVREDLKRVRVKIF